MRILLADDQNEVRSALKIILEQESGLEVSGEAADIKSLIPLACEIRPDLILLDWELGYFKVADIIPVLKGIRPEMRIIALSCRPEACNAAIEAGADAFVSKGDHPEILLDAIRGIEDCHKQLAR